MIRRFLLLIVMLSSSALLYAQLQPREVRDSDPQELQRDMRDVYDLVRLKIDDIVMDTVRQARDSADAAYILADSAQDSAITAMDTALAALAYTLQDVCDNDSVTTTKLYAERVFANGDIMGINRSFSAIGGQLYFYLEGSGAEVFYWDMSAGYFKLTDDLQLAGDLEVNGNDIDIGDVGGFSGIKFNPSTTELEFWIDGSKVGSIGTDGIYDDEVP